MTKTFGNFMEDSSAKKCPSGKYWCFTDKKCKKIPYGYHIGRRGYLEQDDEEKKNGSNNGNGNDNGNGGNGNGSGGNGNGSGNGGGGLGESFNLPLNLEIPSNQKDFDKGLMFRERLSKDSGMLFIFNEVSEKSFHMKNTFIPLDIAFINKDGIIESIKELEPNNLNPVYSDSEVLYALEVNRGWFTEKNIKVGDRVFDSIEEDTVRIDNSDGQEYASVIDVIKPDPMKVPEPSVRWKDLVEQIKKR
tara:strand:- start:514 stop:1254 length:741 start_codon:yes stop_codon:yes gene_type:complete